MNKLDAFWVRSPFVLKLLIIISAIMLIAFSEPLVKDIEMEAPVITQKK